MGGSSSRAVSASTVAMVQQMVSENCVVIFSKTTCGYCSMAKRVFDDIGTPYTAVELNRREDGQELQDVLSDLTGARSVSPGVGIVTVPRVFINGALHWWWIRDGLIAQRRKDFATISRMFRK